MMTRHILVRGLAGSFLLIALCVLSASGGQGKTTQRPRIDRTPDLGAAVETMMPQSTRAAKATQTPPGAAGRDPDLHDGWPVNLQAPGAGFPYTPTLFDADGDGADEIFLTGGLTFGLRGDGSFLPGWPTHEHQYMGYGTNTCKPGPSVADLEGDGDWEILWTERDWWAGGCYMWTFNAKEFDGSDLPNYPQYAPDDYSNALDTAFVLGDTDDDGDLEAWGAHTLGNNFIHYRVSALDELGNRLFTTDINATENILSLYYGDVERDGVNEVFATALLNQTIRLHVFDAEGNEKDGYPSTLYSVPSSSLMFGPPIAADLDHDGDLEFLIGHYTGSTSQAVCVHHDGDMYNGFPIEIATGSQLFYLGLGDVTADGEPELLAMENELAGDYRVWVIDIATGAPLDGWPVHVPGWPNGFPAVVDVDGDAVQDVCVSTGDGEVYAFTGTGKTIEGYPKQMVSASISGVAAGDIDGDGLFELVVSTWDGWVYAWDTPAEARPDRADWPMRGIDARNTLVFGQEPLCPADLNGDDKVDTADLLMLLAAWGSSGPGDIDGDGIVGTADLLALLADWGDCPRPPCPWDFNGDGVVDDLDRDILMEHWGDCPDPPEECPWDLNGDGVVDGLDLMEVLDHYGDCP
jgi:hypothetical protein